MSVKSQKLLELCEKQGLTYDKPSILSLYRSLFRESEKLPTIGRRTFVKSKTREVFRSYLNETDPEMIVAQLRRAVFQIETVKVQAEHLKQFVMDDRPEEAAEQQEEITKEEEKVKEMSTSDNKTRKTWE